MIAMLVIVIVTLTCCGGFFVFVFIFVFDHVLSLSLSVSVIVTPTCRGGEEGIGAVELVANSEVRDLHLSRVRPAIKYLCL